MTATIRRELDLNLAPDFGRRLDAAEALAPGHGMLELRGFVKPDSAGAALDYTHRIADNLSAFATAYGGVALDQAGNLKPDFGAMGGVRLRF